jgi:hypothetical protein
MTWGGHVANTSIGAVSTNRSLLSTVRIAARSSSLSRLTGPGRGLGARAGPSTAWRCAVARDTPRQAGRGPLRDMHPQLVVGAGHHRLDLGGVSALSEISSKSA